MVQRFLLMRGSCPCFVTFRGVVGAKWEQKPGPARAPSRPWFGSRMFSRRTTSPVLSEPLARRALVVGVSRAPGSPLTPLNVSARQGTCFPIPPRSTTHECCAHECCDEMTNFSQIEAALRERSPGLGHTQNGVYHTHHGNEARGAETLGLQDRGAGPWRCAVREGAAARARCALRQSAPKLLCQRGDRARELRDGCGAA